MRVLRMRLETIRIEKPTLSDDDLLESELINGELSGSVSFYYEKVRDIDTRDW